jgi:hypothetical protein
MARPWCHARRATPAQNFLDLVSNTNPHEARTRTARTRTSRPCIAPTTLRGHGWIRQHRRDEQALGYGVMYQDAPFFIWLNGDYPNLDADRYTGGVRLRSPFGTVSTLQSGTASST